MNKSRLIFILIAVLILTTCIFGMASPVNAMSEGEFETFLFEEDIDVLLENPLTWLLGALLLIIFTIFNIIAEIIGTILALIIAIISAIYGIFLLISHLVTSLF